jgi:hypothetical protein
MNRLARLVVPLLVAVPTWSQLTSTTATARAETPFAASKSIFRNHLTNGQDEVVDARTFSVSVSETTGLRGHQSIDVAWSGAHPTGGVVPDPNSGDAKNQEYPVVVLECQGIDSAVDPTGCWTATAAERFQDSFNTAFPPFRIDRYATPADRKAIVGQPSPRPAACFAPSPVEHWVPFRAASGTIYNGGTGGCAGQPPEAANVGGLNLPSNTTYGVTHTDGTGSIKFDVWTAAENASMGCSDTVPCSLVIVPIIGISCDVAAASLPLEDQPGAVAPQADALCRATGQYQPGQLSTSGVQSDVAVSGALWWAASNWQNRISVPLNFATASNACDVIGGAGGLDIYGSELMTQAMQQWAPRFCLDSSLFRLKHVQTPEPQARNILATGNIQAALTSDVSVPASFATITAPVAVTGFSIAFTIDDSNGNQLRTLRLTPRLLAKLLTESYPAINAMKAEYAALAANPMNVTLDPEFIALNPGVTQGVPASQSASTLLALSSDSDVMRALTAYINADPEARLWLDGTPDPWGMVVNPNYKGIALPTASWPLLDTFEPPLLYSSNTNVCLTNEPVPFLPLVAAPVARLQTIALDMQFSLANSQTVCKTIVEGSIDGAKLVPLGRQTIGFRFMIGVTSLADANRFGLDVASLQTQSTASPNSVIDSPNGRTFVAPSDDSLRAAAQLLAKDPASGTWPIPYGTMRTDPSGAGAYPGTMVVYAMLPATGLSSPDAKNLTRFLAFAASEGQTPGLGNGQLPPGYLPLTASNHLQGLAAATSAAAALVGTQVIPDPPATTTTSTTTPSTTVPKPTITAPATTIAAVAPAPVSTSTIPATATTDVVDTIDTTPERAPVIDRDRPADSGTTLGQNSSAGRTVAVLLLVGLVGLLAAVMINLAASRRRAHA